MIFVTTSHGGRNGWRSGDSSTDGELARPGRVEHYTTGAAGLVAALVVLFAFYPTIRALVTPLEALSSTAIVAVGVVSWAATWLALELLWEWRRR